MKTLAFSRFWVIGWIFTLVGALIVFQMLRIQTSQNWRALKDQAVKEYETDTLKIYPERGYIYDRYGNLLAGNREVYEIGVNLANVKNPETIARDLSEILGLDYNELLAKASMPYDKRSRVYVPLARVVPHGKVVKIQAKDKEYDNIPVERKLFRKPTANRASLDGLEFRPQLLRSYPERTLGSNVLGFYAFADPTKGRAYFGVEEHYDELLTGKPVEVTWYHDPSKAAEIPPVPPGASLILTLDRSIQAEMEKIIDRAVADHKAASGTIVILDPKTGEVLAMATTPRLDPNKYWNLAEVFPDNTPYNRGIGETYEPGSVFKVLTMATALDTGVVTPTTPFIDTGSLSIGGYEIYNWDRGAWGPQDMTGCMQHSLNVCLAWVATKIGPANFYKYLENFGIGRRTNIDLAGEVYFPLSVPGDRNWYDVNLATNSYGQGVALAPIQFAMAASALANEGRMMAPHVLKAVIENGHQRPIKPILVGTPVSANTARTLTEMLATSLEEEASNALVPGYRLAGKTGTAEIPGPYGYTTYLTNASFVGWGPVDNPRFVIYIWIEKPATSPWASIVVAPIFREVVSKLVVLMNIPPDEIRHVLYKQ
ncbi:MAG: penicillin-binding protein 2 [Anaerolineaceae bacterium]|nr:penicillin-binding protein 2 [Anaerolineaceae bacterium]